MNDVTADRARAELAWVQDLVHRAEQRIDPHAFHFVHWGLIVLVWYPLSHYFLLTGRTTAAIVTGAISFVLGGFLSAAGEMRLTRHPRLPGEHTRIGNQVGLIAGANVAAGVLLSVFGPSLGFVAGPNMPTVWGLVYANMAVMTGIVYRTEFLWAGTFIFLGCLAAMVWPQWNGYILGPCMGLGMVVPGLMAERRVRAMRANDDG